MSSQSENELRCLINKLQREIRLIGLTLAPLRSDLKFAIERWQAEQKSQFWARTVIRCMCALTEATLFSMRGMAHSATLLTGEKLESEELEILTEKRIISVKGVATTRPKFLPFPDAVKETFRLFAKSSGVVAQVEYTNGFEDLCATFQLRNRLMHPKSTFDLQVSDADISAAERGIHWLYRVQARFFEDVDSQLNNKFLGSPPS